MRRLVQYSDVTFIEESHQYFRNGVEYESQSSFTKLFEEKFDAKAVSGFMAKNSDLSQEQILQSWKDKADEAATEGTRVHEILEHSWDSINLHGYNDQEVRMIRILRDLVYPRKAVFPEKILYLDEYRLCGTADLPVERCTIGGRQVIDCFDYKTNSAKGITLFHSTLKNGEFRHRKNGWFLEPISHLESCLYNKYALQLSLYMYMMEVNYDIIPGRLGIIHVENLIPRMIPVPYLKLEVKAMLDYYSQLKPLHHGR